MLKDSVPCPIPFDEKDAVTRSFFVILVAPDALGEGEAQNIVKAMVEKATGGDPCRTILERVSPPRRGARVQFGLPDFATAGQLPGAIAAVNRQVAEGDLSPDEGALIVGLLETHRKAIETSDLAARLTALRGGGWPQMSLVVRLKRLQQRAGSANLYDGLTEDELDAGDCRP